MSYDKFIRTTSPKYEAIVKEFYSCVLANGDGVIALSIVKHLIKSKFLFFFFFWVSASICVENLL